MVTEVVWFDTKPQAVAFVNLTNKDPQEATVFSHFEYDLENRTAAVLVNLAADGELRIDDYSCCTALPDEIQNHIVDRETASA